MCSRVEQYLDNDDCYLGDDGRHIKQFHLEQAMDFQGKFHRMDERGGSVHDRFHYLLCLTVRIGTDLEFPTYDRSLLQPLDWNGFLYGD